MRFLLQSSVAIAEKFTLQLDHQRSMPSTHHSRTNSVGVSISTWPCKVHACHDHRWNKEAYSFTNIVKKYTWVLRHWISPIHQGLEVSITQILMILDNAFYVKFVDEAPVTSIPFTSRSLIDWLMFKQNNILIMCYTKIQKVGSCFVPLWCAELLWQFRR